MNCHDIHFDQCASNFHSSSHIFALTFYCFLQFLFLSFWSTKSTQRLKLIKTPLASNNQPSKLDLPISCRFKTEPHSSNKLLLHSSRQDTPSLDPSNLYLAVWAIIRVLNIMAVKSVFIFIIYRILRRFQPLFFSIRLFFMVIAIIYDRKLTAILYNINDGDLWKIQK